MHPANEEALKRRVVGAAQAVTHHQYVSAIDVLVRAGLLEPTRVQTWKKGRVDFLEHVI
jgi:hypothetical protein